MDNKILNEGIASFQNVLPEGFEASKLNETGKVKIFKEGEEVTTFDSVQVSVLILLITRVKSECLEEMSSQNENHLNFLGDLKKVLKSRE